MRYCQPLSSGRNSEDFGGLLFQKHLQRGCATSPPERRFLALPCSRNPRWLIPLDDAGAKLNGLKIFAPYTRRARFVKSAVSFLLKAGWRGIAHDHVILNIDELFGLGDLIWCVAAEETPQLSIYIGRATQYRKITVQVMRTGGETIGFIKLPLTPKAEEHVHHEGQVLECLGRHPPLRSHIPRVLFSGDWKGVPVLFQSPLDGKPGPPLFGNVHSRFLIALSQVEHCSKHINIVLDSVAYRVKRQATLTGLEWPSLAREVFRVANLAFSASPVACGLIHGDFAPWNTVVKGDHVSVFDWEYAAEGPVGYDVFHFAVQTRTLIGKKLPFSRLIDAVNYSVPRVIALFLLYLLDSASRLADDGIRPDSPAMQYRRTQIVQILRREIPVQL